MYTVYLIKRDNIIPCYVGMTSRTLKKRFWEHCNDKNCTMYEQIKKHGREHFTIEEIDKSDNKKDAILKECFWTVFYKERFTLYNKSIGNIPNDETRRKMSNSRKGEKAPFFGRHHTESVRKKISEAQKGKYTGENSPCWGKRLSDEHRKKLSDAKKKHSVQCIETGIIYESMSEAQRQTKIYSGNISRACRKQKTAGGFHWRYIAA